MEQWIVFNDSHIPFQDDEVLGMILDFARTIKPEGVVILGDLVDFYSISRFDKDPARISSFQEEIDQAVNYLSKWRTDKFSPRMRFVEGNHEARLRRFLWSHGQGLSSLRSLKLENLLELKEFGIKFYPYYGGKRTDCRLGDLWLFHGNMIRKHSGYTAKAMLDKHGVSLMCGHTHRDGKHTKRNRGGHLAAWENYCTCSLNPEYNDFPNWTQGFSVVTIIGRRPYVEQIAIINGKFIYGGKLHGGKK